MSRNLNAIREHKHFLIVVITLIVMMTFPTVVYVFRTDVFWLPTGRGDLLMKFWDAWYGRAILSGAADFYHTDKLFHPQGLSLVYHNFSIPHMIVFGLLQLVMPTANAYNLCYLLIIFVTTLSAYIYLLYLFEDKWISLFGAVVFGLSGYVAGRSSQPDVALIATLPLSLYCFHRGVLEERPRLMLLAGALAGATAFIGMYTFVCIVMTLGLAVLYFARGRWRNRVYWLRILALVGIISLISGWRIMPMLADSIALDQALSKSGQTEQDNDLLQFFINHENPLTMRLFTNRVAQRFIELRNPPLWWNTAYLGIVPLFLFGLGLFKPQLRRKMLPWLLLLLPFFILRLGSSLTINGLVYDIRLPKHFLDELAPAVFEAFHATDHFQAGVLLPWSALSCFGLMGLTQSLPQRQRTLVILLLIALVAVEYYRRLEPRIIAKEETAFLDWLDGEGNGRAPLIYLPMNRGNSKIYGFYQTLNGLPHVEGLASRTPPNAYDYIHANLLLDSWRAKKSIICEQQNRAAYLSALKQLGADGFTHVVLHYRLLKQRTIAESFTSIEPAYEDDFVAIYRLDSLQSTCA